MKKTVLLSFIALFAVITATAQSKVKKMDEPTNKFEILRQHAANATGDQKALEIKAGDTSAFPTNDKFELLRQHLSNTEEQNTLDNKADNTVKMHLNAEDKLEMLKNRNIKAKKHQRETENNTSRKVVIKPHMRSEGDTIRVRGHHPKP